MDTDKKSVAYNNDIFPQENPAEYRYQIPPRQPFTTRGTIRRRKYNGLFPGDSIDTDIEKTAQQQADQKNNYTKKITHKTHLYNSG